jgi:hypothetical protein
MATLAQRVTAWREMLDDTEELYLWSNDELTSYADNLQKQIAADIPLLIDRSTSAICEVSLSQSDGLIDLDPRIIRITRAKIDGESRFLVLQDSEHMDTYYPEWDSTADEDTSTILVVNGVGTDQAFLYPPMDDSGTLKLVVVRLPLVTLDWTTHNAVAMELDKYAHLFIHGIMRQAYLKQDTDTYDRLRSEQHRVLWEGENGGGGDMEKIRLMVHRLSSRPQTASPMRAFL